MGTHEVPVFIFGAIGAAGACCDRMWLYPEVMPAMPRRRIRWWMYAVLGFAAASTVILLAMPRATKGPLAAELDASVARIEAARLEAQLVQIDHDIAWAYRDTGAQWIPPCDAQCEQEREDQVRFRREVVARLRALRARIALTPQPTTGVSLSPACLTHPFAKGCS